MSDFFSVKRMTAVDLYDRICWHSYSGPTWSSSSWCSGVQEGSAVVSTRQAGARYTTTPYSEIFLYSENIFFPFSPT